jgi:hypothetical protein
MQWAVRTARFPKIPRQMPIRYRQDFATVMDGRSRLAREVRDPLSALLADLGGEDVVSHAALSLISESGLVGALHRARGNAHR